MKTVMGATAGLRREHLSTGTCVLEDKPAAAVGSSGTIWSYVPAHPGEWIPINVKEKVEATGMTGVYQFQFPLPDTNLCYWALKEIIPGFEYRPIVVSVKEKTGVAQLQFPSPGMLYTVWTSLTPHSLEPSESAEKTSRPLLAGGAATVNEKLIGPEGAPPRWTELALSVFPRMRGMTATESAAYKALKKRVFQRR